MKTALLLAIATSSTVVLGDVIVFSEDFDSYNSDSFSGTDGWYSGFSDDDWSTQSTDNVYATTDKKNGSWGSGKARDNHLVYTGAAWADFTFDLNVMSDDDDTIGVVFRYQDNQNFYLLILVGGDNYPSSGTDEVDEAYGAGLYVVSNGVSSLLSSSQYAFYEGYTHNLRIVADGPLIDVYFDIDLDGSYAGVEHLFSISDSTLSTGNIGLYCFDNGGGNGGCAFDDVVVSLSDFDGDGVVDIEDNCEEDANPDQDDLDLDGVGDLCDDDADGDGYAEGEGDCNDLDNAINTDADEYCDGIDNNCDGEIDEAGAVDAEVWYEDSDGDGYGDPEMAYRECYDRDGIVDNDLDCDDSDPDVYPGAEGWSDDCEEIMDTAVVDTGDSGVVDTGEISLDTAIIDDSSVEDELTGSSVIAAGTGCGCLSGGDVKGSWFVPFMLLFVRRRRG